MSHITQKLPQKKKKKKSNMTNQLSSENFYRMPGCSSENSEKQSASGHLRCHFRSCLV